MADAANAATTQILQQPLAARELISARLHFHHHRLLSDPHFVRDHYVAWHASIRPAASCWWRSTQRMVP
jgi:hypothetical protein